jgi:hypothetical protein
MRNLLLGLLTLSFASVASAVTFVEIGDAPQSVPGQDTVGGVLPLEEIVGTFEGFSDVDIYRINIVDPANFRATTSGDPALDTQLFLFDTLGFGIGANDDRSDLDPECATFQDCWSDLGSIPGLSVGIYSLAVSRYPYMPFSNSAARARFSLSTSPTKRWIPSWGWCFLRDRGPGILWPPGRIPSPSRTPSFPTTRSR